MADISVQFTNKINGYDKNEVDEFVRVAESKLQEKAVEVSELQNQVAELEFRLNKFLSTDVSIEEKVETYDKLMRKMDGDYKNLLAPAIAKAKSIESKAEKEYRIRIDQARYAAEGIYKETADRIAGVVDENMDRVYGLIGDFLKTQTLVGRMKTFVRECKNTSIKAAWATKNRYVKAKENAKAKRLAKRMKKQGRAPSASNGQTVNA